MLTVEIKGPRGWVSVDELHPGGKLGSMSDNAPEGRQILVFFCLHGRAVVVRSLHGEDFEAGRGRVLDSDAIEVLAILERSGEFYEKWVRTDRGTSVLVRWAYRA